MRERHGIAGIVRQAEVGHPDRPLLVKQKVRRLDIAMDHALGMSIGERLGNLHADPGRLAVVKTGQAASAGGERPSAPDRARAGDVLHDVECAPLVLADPEDRHDVGVMQPAGGFRLAAEAGQVSLRGRNLIATCRLREPW